MPASCHGLRLEEGAQRDSSQAAASQALACPIWAPLPASHLLSQICLCRDLSSVAAPYSCVTDAGLSHLGNCASLRSVDVSFCTLITDRGLVALAAGLCTKLQRLQTFRVSMFQAALLGACPS